MKKLIELLTKRQKINQEIKQEQRKQHNVFVKENKNFILLMDIIVVLVILMNFGALVVTTAIVTEEKFAELKAQNKTVRFFEANPIMAETHNLQSIEDMPVESQPAIKKETSNIILTILKQAMIWVLLLLFYIYNRRKVYGRFYLNIMLFIVCFYFFLLGIDFFRNVGIYIAKSACGV